MKRILKEHWLLLDYEIYYNPDNKTCYIIDHISTKLFMVVKKVVGAENYVVCTMDELKGGRLWIA